MNGNVLGDLEFPNFKDWYAASFNIRSRADFENGIDSYLSIDLSDTNWDGKVVNREVVFFIVPVIVGMVLNLI